MNTKTSVLFLTILIFGLSSASFAVDILPVPNDDIGKLVNIYNYNEGMLVSVYDAGKDMTTYYAAGKADRVSYIGTDGKEIVVMQNVYSDGMQTKSIDQYGNVTEYKNGRAIQEINAEGFVTTEYEYDEKGSLSKKNSFDKVKGNREKISYIEYENGREKKAVSLWKNEASETDVNGDGVVDMLDYKWTAETKDIMIYTWDGSNLISTEDKTTDKTTFYKGGKPYQIKNKEDQVIGRYTYNSDGVKLEKVEEMDPTTGKVTSTTYIDKHGREDYMTDDAGNVKQRWTYNDTSAVITKTYTYKDPVSGESKSITEKFNPGANVTTVQSIDSKNYPNWVWTIYYNIFGKPKAAVESGTPS